jgi:hypothetical protein
MLVTDAAAGTAKISCDSCPASMESVANRDQRAAREQAVHLARIARWQIERHAGAWQHFCPACRQSRHRGPLL